MLSTLERYLTFHPDAADHGGLLGLQYERFRFGAEFGLDLDAIWLPQSSSATVLFIHGNRHNLTKFRDHYILFQSLGFSCLAFDFPGYGASQGKPSEHALYTSARAAYDFVTNKLARRKPSIALYGCSLGGAVAIEIAQDNHVGCLITEGTFTNSHEMAEHLYPYLPIYRLLPNRFNNEAKINSITIPKMIIHGQVDTRVPVRMAHALAKKATDPVSTVLVDKAGHIDCVPLGGESLRRTIQEFITNNCSDKTKNTISYST